MARDKRVIKSYVWHGGRCFFVSTIERDSSAAWSPRRFYETLVWRCDSRNGERGALIAQEGCLLSPLRQHFSICESLHEKGWPVA